MVARVVRSAPGRVPRYKCAHEMPIYFTGRWSHSTRCVRTSREALVIATYELASAWFMLHRIRLSKQELKEIDSRPLLGLREIAAHKTRSGWQSSHTCTRTSASFGGINESAADSVGEALVGAK